VGPQIKILNGSALQDSTLHSIARTVESIFDVPVFLEQTLLDLNLAYDPSRNQANSTALLAQILIGLKGISEKRIAIVDVDLFIPILTFVFGEAQLNGNAAVVSTHRLTNHYYGLPRDDALTVLRLEKEVVHELGHTFGLCHCRYFECVMRTSTYVEEIDLKSVRPCPACSDALLAARLRPLED
jgi:archaemetzincin